MRSEGNLRDSAQDAEESILATQAFTVLSSHPALDSLYVAFPVSSVRPHLSGIPGLHVLEWRKRASTSPACCSTLYHSCRTFMFSLKGVKHPDGAHTGLIGVIFQVFFFFLSIAVVSPLWHKWIPIMLWCLPLSQNFSTVEEIIDSYWGHSNISMQLVGTCTFVSTVSGKLHNNQRKVCPPNPRALVHRG